MKSYGVIGMAIALSVLLAVMTITFISTGNTGGVTVEKEYKIPPIDAARPAETETATFAMG